ncbi:MAG: type II toxin-antitoxin system HicA family toxin [Thauera sp.]|nr:type II toxin-antitoxin system HicA family toxin [Thauera sp.]
MSHKHLSLLRAIYQDPPSANIHWREVESLLNHLGATLEPAHGARFRAVLNRVEVFLHHPHNSSTCAKQDIKHLREFLAQAGVTLASYEADHG